MLLTSTQNEKKALVFRPELQPNQSSLCSLLCISNGGGGGHGQAISTKRIADRRSKRSRKIIDEKREKYRAKNIADTYKLIYQKGKVESNEQSWKIGQQKQVFEKGRNARLSRFNNNIEFSVLSQS